MPAWFSYVFPAVAVALLGLLLGWVFRKKPEPAPVELPTPELNPVVMAATKKAEVEVAVAKKQAELAHDKAINSQVEELKKDAPSLVEDDQGLNEYLKQVGKGARS